MGSTAYEIAMLSVSGVILLLTGIAVLVTVLRKYWKQHRSLEELCTGAVVMVTDSHKRNCCNEISPPDLSSQPHIPSTCEVMDKTFREKREHSDTSLSRPVE
ncbi:uncharacterized protein LOC144691541 [Cetorhinus maximus]